MGSGNTVALNPASTFSLDLFEHQQGLVLPADLRTYFHTLNGTGDEYEDTYFRFTSLAEFTALPALLADWNRDSPYHQLLEVVG